MIVSLIVVSVLVPIVALTVHECAHGLVVARYTGRRTAISLGMGPHRFDLRLGPLDVDVRSFPIRTSCTVDLTGLPAHAARKALRAGSFADLAGAGVCLLAIPFVPGGGVLWSSVASMYLWWWWSSIRSRHGLRFGEDYESDGYRLRELDASTEAGVVAKAGPAAPDSLIAFIAQEAPELLGHQEPQAAVAAAASSPAQPAERPAAGPPAKPAASLYAFIEQTSPELLGKEAAPQATAPTDDLAAYIEQTAPQLLAQGPAPGRRADPRAATSVPPPGLR